MSDPTVVISFKDLAVEERVRDSVDKRCQGIADQFHEITRIEVTLTEDGAGFTAHGQVHVAGKNTDVNTHAEATDLGPAADLLLDRIEKQLRKVHDKRIFSQRREAQRDRGRRESSG